MARGLAWGDVRLVEFGAPDKTRPALVAPFEAELFGHEWLEGPLFLERLLRRMAASRTQQYTRRATKATSRFKRVKAPRDSSSRYCALRGSVMTRITFSQPWMNPKNANPRPYTMTTASNRAKKPKTNSADSVTHRPRS